MVDFVGVDNFDLTIGDRELLRAPPVVRTKLREKRNVECAGGLAQDFPYLRQ